MTGAALGPDRLSTAGMLTLSFGTGVLDAATYLGLDQVFTANMTGNVSTPDRDGWDVAVTRRNLAGIQVTSRPERVPG